MIRSELASLATLLTMSFNLVSIQRAQPLDGCLHQRSVRARVCNQQLPQAACAGITGSQGLVAITDLSVIGEKHRLEGSSTGRRRAPGARKETSLRQKHKSVIAYDSICDFSPSAN